MRPYSSPLVWILTFFLLLFIYTKLAGPIPFSVSSVTTQKTDTFQVSGDSRVFVKPDIAVVSAGVATSGQTVKVVQDQINEKISKISSAIKQLGVDAKDIQTESYNIHPSIDYREGSQKINGYSATTNLSIRVRKIDNVSQVIDAATANGANQIGGVSFDVDDKAKAQNEAREIAVREAKKKAAQAAKVAGFKLGRIINYSENSGEDIRVIPIGMIAADSKEAPGTQLESGSSEILMIVTLSFEIN